MQGSCVEFWLQGFARKNLMIFHWSFGAFGPTPALWRLIDNGDSTVTDRATGLMWQKGGSLRSLSNYRAKSYIKNLNKDKFAGYSGWRLPSIEELASILEKSKKNNLHINSIFDNMQKRCWSADGTTSIHGADGEAAAWIVDFENGKVNRAVWWNIHRYKHIRFGFLPKNYVRAVRSVK